MATAWQVIIIGLHTLLLAGAVLVPVSAMWDACASDYGNAGWTLDSAGVIRWGRLLLNTLGLAAIAVTLALTLGTAGGVLLARTDLPGRRLLAGLVLLAACIPVYVSATLVFSVVPAWQLTGSLAACGGLYGLVYTPLAIILLWATLRSTDREIEDATLLDAEPRRVVWHVTLRQARWGMGLVGTVIVLLVATDFTITNLLVVRTFAEEVYTQYRLKPRSSGPLLTAVPIFLLVATMLWAVQRRYGLLDETSGWSAGRPPRQYALGAWRGPALAAVVLLALVVVGMPLGATLRQVLPVSAVPAAIRGVWPDLRNAALLGACGATVIVLPAVGLAWGMQRGGRVRWPIGAALLLLLAMPAPVIGISLIRLLNVPGWRGGIYDSAAIVVIGYFVRYLAVGVLLLAPAVRRVPRDMEDAARVDGCNWAGMQWHVYWAALRPPIAIVWLVLLILCFAEIGATVLIVPPAWPVASVRAFTLMHFGVYRDLATLVLLAAGCTLIPWAALLWCARRARASP